MRVRRILSVYSVSYIFPRHTGVVECALPIVRANEGASSGDQLSEAELTGQMTYGRVSSLIALRDTHPITE